MDLDQLTIGGLTSPAQNSFILLCSQSLQIDKLGRVVF